MPAIVRNRVVFPAPLRPMMPYTEPAGTSKLTPRSASISIVCFERLAKLASVPLSVGFRSRVARKLTHRSSTRTAGGESESYGKVTFPSEKHHGTEEEEPDRPRGR